MNFRKVIFNYGGDFIYPPSCYEVAPDTGDGLGL